MPLPQVSLPSPLGSSRLLQAFTMLEQPYSFQFGSFWGLTMQMSHYPCPRIRINLYLGLLLLLYKMSLYKAPLSRATAWQQSISSYHQDRVIFLSTVLVMDSRWLVNFPTVVGSGQRCETNEALEQSRLYFSLVPCPAKPGSSAGLENT